LLLFNHLLEENYDKAKIGVVCGLRKTFDYEAANKKFFYIQKIERIEKNKNS